MRAILLIRLKADSSNWIGALVENARKIEPRPTDSRPKGKVGLPKLVGRRGLVSEPS
jgi:hypothetical protein